MRALHAKAGPSIASLCAYGAPIGQHERKHAMLNGEQWASQELAKHATPESKRQRLASELAAQELFSDLPRPPSVSARQWAESAKGHALLIDRLEKALAA